MNYIEELQKAIQDKTIELAKLKVEYRILTIKTSIKKERPKTESDFERVNLAKTLYYDQNLTLEEIGLKLGINKSTVYRWIAGHNKPRKNGILIVKTNL